jgi:hypothetical protein
MERSTQILILMSVYAIPVIAALVYRIKKQLKKQKI